jgi:uncharacterized protein (DUF58 family)
MFQFAPWRARAPVTPDGPPTAGASEWQFTGQQPGRLRAKRWSGLLWALVYPYRGNRLLLTVPGCVVIAVALGIGAAAYNTANNILFIALSLLLACLVFSGILSWCNLRHLAWRLCVPAPVRAGQEHPGAIELHNGKRLLPTYAVWFEVATPGEKKPLRLPLRVRLDPQASTTLDWTLPPAKRGRWVVEVRSASSLFPFGFLKKTLGFTLRRELLVWPAPVAYQRLAATAWSQPGQAEHSRRAGQSGDLLALRSYVQGDCERRVHWKASARLGRLLVRQHAAETQAGYTVWVLTALADWPRPEQFELMCSLAATLAEDFFRAGRLVAVAFDDSPPQPVRRRHDLDRFLDRLALIQPTAPTGPSPGRVRSSRRTNLLRLAPDGARGVAAYLDATKAATA